MKSFCAAHTGFDVVMLTTVHTAADVRILDREAKTLSDAGLKVCIVGQHPMSEYLGGVWIEALPTPVNRWRRLLLGFTAFKQALRLRGKLYIFHDPELFGVGLVLRFLGRKVVYDCHENTTMTIEQKAWIPSSLRFLVILIVGASEWLGARLLTGVMTVDENLQKRFPQKRTITIRNLPPAAMLDTIGQALPLRSRANTVIYAGNLTRIRGIRELVEAFRGINSNAELWLVGEFTEPGFQQEILGSLPPKVKWFGPKKWSEVIELYHRAKVGAVLHHPTPNHRNAMPIKLFEYLGAGLPVIASDMPHFRELLQGCGVQVDPTNVVQIRAAIEELFSDEDRMAEMSKLGRERIVKCFRWEDDGRKLVDFCTRIAIGGKRSASHSELRVGNKSPCVVERPHAEL